VFDKGCFFCFIGKFKINNNRRMKDEENISTAQPQTPEQTWISRQDGFQRGKKSSGQPAR
jgi:hypothetical protein